MARWWKRVKVTTERVSAEDALTMFTFEEILDEIDRKRAAAKTNVESWDRLRDVAAELAGSPSPSEVWPTPNVGWTLAQVSIQGYRGVSNNDPLVINFDPTPGLTVLHGLNGAGKSSISDAIEVGLTGKTSAGSAGTAGKAALWDPVHLASGAQSAHIGVTLVSGNHKLILSTLLDSNGTVQTHTAEIANGAERREVKLDPSWHQALISHQPVFAYASLERRVQLSKDLAAYFEGLLALGGSFMSLQEAIASRASASDAAFGRWRAARAEAMQALNRVDADRDPGTGATPLNPVIEPHPGSDVDVWLQESGLLQDGIATAPLPKDSDKQLSEAASSVGAAITAFEKARLNAEQSLSAALDHLHSEAKAMQLEDGACPVCLTPNSNWLARLEDTVRSNADLTRLRGVVDSETRVLATLSRDLLVPAIWVGALAGAEEPITTLAATAQELFSSFETARAEHHSAQHQALHATARLANWLVSPDAQALVRGAVERTDVNKQWRIARARAVEAFVVAWRSEGTLAAESVSWADTLKRVEDLRKQLRKKRSVTLQGRAGTRIESLLADADLHLQSITVLSTKASMELVDESGVKVDLGMLSAGQRNAVLLAPLLASVDAGPFNFLVLDDPVHAFDELRIDRLASSLAQIAQSRRVIVLTHDDRLKEYLAARMPEADTSLVDRSSDSGTVAVIPSTHFWHELLNDAGDVHDIALRETGSTSAVTGALRGLCRMAVDNALRSFTLRNAVLGGRDANADLAELDARYKTNDRLDQAASYWQGSSWLNPVTRASQHCAPHLVAWNNAVHGNPPSSDFSRDEVRDARKACKALSAVS